MKIPTLTLGELNFLFAQCPQTYRSLGDYHSVQATMADASDFKECVPHHEARGREMVAVADFIQTEHEEEGREARFENTVSEATLHQLNGLTVFLESQVRYHQNGIAAKDPAVVDHIDKLQGWIKILKDM